MPLNPEHLLTFVHVTRQGSLSGAAETLNLTQPAVSSQMKLLTHAVGEPLFTRHRTGVILTQVGEGLLPHALALTRALDGAQGYVRDLRGLASGTLSVAASSTIAAAIVPAVLAHFHTQYPAVAIQVRQGNTSEVMTALHGGQVEIALIEGSPGPLGPDVQVQVFGEDELVLVTSPDHPLARAGSDLTALPLVWRERGSGTREVAELALARAGLSTITLLELPGTEAVKEAVIGGLGMAFVSDLRVRRELRAGILTQVSVQLPGLRRPLTQVTPPPEQQSRAARAFLHLLHHTAQNATDAGPG